MFFERQFMKYEPTSAEFSTRASFSIISRVARAAHVQNGLPPNVVPWAPGENADATKSFARIAEIGTPPPRALALVTISGSIP